MSSDFYYAFREEHVFRSSGRFLKDIIESIIAILISYGILNLIERFEYPVAVGNNKYRHDERERQTDDRSAERGSP